VAFFADKFESGLLVKVPGAVKLALSSQEDTLMSRLAGKADAFGDKAFADSQAAS
jgi:hypothetical protein